MPKASRRTSKPNSKPQQDKQDTKQEPQSYLSKYQEDLAKWSAVAASPNLSPQAAQVAQNLVRSKQAALTLGQKALLYQEPQGDPEGQPKPPPESLVPAD